MEKNKPIIALDFKSREEAIEFLERFPAHSLNVKVGMELFYSAGSEFVKEVVQRGHKVFLDLKLYDIPNTVKNAMTQLAKLGISMVNVHASGGIDMMTSAKEGLEAGTEPGQPVPLLIAVTQLTSREPSENVSEQQLAVSQEENILHLAQLTNQSELDGVVCSPLEVRRIKENIGNEFLTVTPGIRIVDQVIQTDDQVRVTTPRLAAEWGSDYIVVGRPITKAANPVAAYQKILEEWHNALKGIKE